MKLGHDSMPYSSGLNLICKISRRSGDFFNILTPDCPLKSSCYLVLVPTIKRHTYLKGFQVTSEMIWSYRFACRITKRCIRKTTNYSIGKASVECDRIFFHAHSPFLTLQMLLDWHLQHVQHSQWHINTRLSFLGQTSPMILIHTESNALLELCDASTVNRLLHH